MALKAPRFRIAKPSAEPPTCRGASQEADGRPRPVRRLLDRMEPLPRGAKVRVRQRYPWRLDSKNYIPAVEKGIVDIAERGFLAGFPMVDSESPSMTGSYHDVDSSELAFKLAARKAFRTPWKTAKPTLLEPVDECRSAGAVEYAGDLMAISRPPWTHPAWKRRVPPRYHTGAGPDGGNAQLSEHLTR